MHSQKCRTQVYFGVCQSVTNFLFPKLMIRANSECIHVHANTTILPMSEVYLISRNQVYTYL